MYSITVCHTVVFLQIILVCHVVTYHVEHDKSQPTKKLNWIQIGLDIINVQYVVWNMKHTSTWSVQYSWNDATHKSLSHKNVEIRIVFYVMLIARPKTRLNISVGSYIACVISEEFGETVSYEPIRASIAFTAHGPIQDRVFTIVDGPRVAV